VNSGSLAPFLGASGAIAGVMGAYLVFWPRARILTLLILVVLFIPFYLPAWFVLGSWIILQFFTDPNSGVAWVAHVGGFAAGVLIALALQRMLPPPRPRPVRDHRWM
jgi:membrane associated rhomboid family serine protease